MVLEPSLLLADEPTGNLDRATGEAIHQLFLDLNRERGSTLLVVTHNPELARLMPRRLRMIDGGRLVEESESTYRGPANQEISAPAPTPIATPKLADAGTARAIDQEDEVGWGRDRASGEGIDPQGGRGGEDEVGWGRDRASGEGIDPDGADKPEDVKDDVNGSDVKKEAAP
jgi:ABC-type multidrug transport system ATPase subunit